MNLDAVRAQFPALATEPNRIFFDNAAGTQVARSCLERMAEYLVRDNANLGGLFPRSRRSDALQAECRRAVADFLGAADPSEVAFGANMTTLTQAFARAFGRLCRPGDEIVTTRLEHDANVAPWLALEERGVVVRFADLEPADVTLDLEHLRAQLSERTRLVAVGYASNAFGTVNPVADVARLAHEVGALCFVDAVHYAPHGPIDVAALGCDVLLCSAYKFFGPHVGVLWGRRAVMEAIPAYHLRTVPAVMPNKFESGTANLEGLAGTLGAIEYLESLAPAGATRRRRLVDAMAAIAEVERALSRALLAVQERLPRVRVYGITARGRLAERVPTFAVTIDRLTPGEAALRLAAQGIDVWSGNYYALEPMTRLGLETGGGAVRISPVHYNTLEEVERLGEALAALGEVS
jgi:cysteine desulfurase family protein (TIGR01976 family)